VACGDDLGNALRVTFGNSTRYEECGPHRFTLEKGQQFGHRDLRSIGALRKDTRLVGVLRVIADPNLLGIEVET
jgi:hypothetical protein